MGVSVLRRFVMSLKHYHLTSDDDFSHVMPDLIAKLRFVSRVLKEPFEKTGFELSEDDLLSMGLFLWEIAADFDSINDRLYSAKKPTASDRRD
jgi:hypothetical protein